MKRAITIIIMAVMMLSATACTAYASNNEGNRGYPEKVKIAKGFHYKQVKAKKGYVTKFYNNKKVIGKIKTKRRVKVYVVYSEEVYPQFLWERKNNFICVEVIRGECINDEGDGTTTDGYYISYKNVKGHEVGAKYETYCIYANNNYEDDVKYRIDYRK